MSTGTKVMNWQKLGRILQPERQADWLATFAGPSFAMVEPGQDLIKIYVTGRDDKNRSRIGIVDFDMKNMKVHKIHEKPVLDLGTKGAFDQNGTGYPCLVPSDGKLFMFYVGWVPAVMVPFQNDIGLAASADGMNFTRVSRAPIVPRSNEDPYSLGSVSVMKEGEIWRMWYTTFESWPEDAADPKHFYHIKYAESPDGVNWRRDNHVCVTYDGIEEYVLGKPSVLKHQGRYHMWYCKRGQAYTIGYAHSMDGINWTRRDELVGIECSAQGWDYEAITYPHVFFHNQELYMLYNGNDYGKTGLGLARLKDLKDLTDN